VLRVNADTDTHCAKGTCVQTWRYTRPPAVLLCSSCSALFLRTSPSFFLSFLEATHTSGMRVIQIEYFFSLHISVPRFLPVCWYVYRCSEQAKHRHIHSDLLVSERVHFWTFWFVVASEFFSFSDRVVEARPLNESRTDILTFSLNILWSSGIDLIIL